MEGPASFQKISALAFNKTGDRTPLHPRRRPLPQQLKNLDPEHLFRHGQGSLEGRLPSQAASGARPLHRVASRLQHHCQWRNRPQRLHLDLGRLLRSVGALACHSPAAARYHEHRLDLRWQKLRAGNRLQLRLYRLLLRGPQMVADQASSQAQVHCHLCARAPLR